MENPKIFLSTRQLAWFVNIPFYKGKDDRYGYDDWEYYIEDFFASCKLSEEEMYYCARWKMAGEAGRWWYVYGKGCQFWYQMKAELQHRYLPKRHAINHSEHILQFRRESEEFCRACKEFSRASKESFQKLSDMFALYKEQQDAKLKLEVQSQPAPEPEHDIEPKVEPKHVPEVEPEYKFEPKIEPEPEVGHKPECDLEPPIEPDAAVQLDFRSEPVTAPATELHSEFSLHIPLQLIQHIDFVISEPPPLTNQQFLRVCLSFLEPPYLHENVRIRIHLLSHFKIRGRVFSNTKTLHIHVSFLFTIHQEVNLSKPRRMIGDPKQQIYNLNFL